MSRMKRLKNEYARLAQLVEHLTLNQGVQGSNLIAHHGRATEVARFFIVF